jgi:hypothetical protein
MLNTMRTGIVVALLGITVGCGATSPAGPTAAAVTPLLVGTAPVPRTGSVTLTPSVNAIARGAELSLSWSVSSEGGNDWIELSKTTDSNLFHGWSAFTEGKTSGTFTLTAPSEAGQYEFRYLIDDGWSDVARSTMVTVF